MSKAFICHQIPDSGTAATDPLSQWAAEEIVPCGISSARPGFSAASPGAATVSPGSVTGSPGSVTALPLGSVIAFGAESHV